MDKQTDGLTDR